ncbi:wd g-beta repeat-containing protein [Cystoisospora suis]|uniref:Wd g-beta repeat-containing protein n=1 Tax=Cystoisospora suis TaxID=483139 RepID=A0A2C6L280_9APIC|nr:wd g-beta repeat-containing protein [Cystoisospora suis]
MKKKEGKRREKISQQNEEDNDTHVNLQGEKEEEEEEEEEDEEIEQEEEDEEEEDETEDGEKSTAVGYMKKEEKEKKKKSVKQDKRGENVRMASEEDEDEEEDEEEQSEREEEEDSESDSSSPTRNSSSLREEKTIKKKRSSTQQVEKKRRERSSSIPSSSDPSDSLHPVSGTTTRSHPASRRLQRGVHTPEHPRRHNCSFHHKTEDISIKSKEDVHSSLSSTKKEEEVHMYERELKKKVGGGILVQRSPVLLDGGRLLACSRGIHRNPEICFFSLKKRRFLYALRGGHTDTVTSMLVLPSRKISPDASLSSSSSFSLLLSTSLDSSLCLWSLRPPHHHTPGKIDQSSSASFSVSKNCLGKKEKDQHKAFSPPLPDDLLCRVSIHLPILAACYAPGSREVFLLVQENYKKRKSQAESSQKTGRNESVISHQRSGRDDTLYGVCTLQLGELLSLVTQRNQDGLVSSLQEKTDEEEEEESEALHKTAFSCERDAFALLPKVLFSFSDPPSAWSVSVSGRFVGIASGRKILIYSRDMKRVLQLKHIDRLVQVSIHPKDEFIAAGDNTGRIVLWSSLDDKSLFSSSSAVSCLPTRLHPLVSSKRREGEAQKKEIESDDNTVRDASSESDSSPSASSRKKNTPAACSSSSSSSQSKKKEKNEISPSSFLLPPPLQFSHSSSFLHRRSHTGKKSFSSSSSSLPSPPVVLHWHAHAVTSLAFSSDGLILFSGGEEGVLVLWYIKQAFQRQFLPRLGSPILHISSSASSFYEEKHSRQEDEGNEEGDGRDLLAISCTDNSIKIIDTVHLHVLHSIQGLDIPPLHLFLSGVNGTSIPSLSSSCSTLSPSAALGGLSSFLLDNLACTSPFFKKKEEDERSSYEGSSLFKESLSILDGEEEKEERTRRKLPIPGGDEKREEGMRKKGLRDLCAACRRGQEEEDEEKKKKKRKIDEKEEDEDEDEEEEKEKEKKRKKKNSSKRGMLTLDGMSSSSLIGEDHRCCKSCGRSLPRNEEEEESLRLKMLSNQENEDLFFSSLLLQHERSSFFSSRREERGVFLSPLTPLLSPPYALQIASDRQIPIPSFLLKPSSSSFSSSSPYRSFQASFKQDLLLVSSHGTRLQIYDQGNDRHILHLPVRPQCMYTSRIDEDFGNRWTLTHASADCLCSSLAVIEVRENLHGKGEERLLQEEKERYRCLLSSLREKMMIQGRRRRDRRKEEKEKANEKKRRTQQESSCRVEEEEEEKDEKKKRMKRGKKEDLSHRCDAAVKSKNSFSEEEREKEGKEKTVCRNTSSNEEREEEEDTSEEASERDNSPDFTADEEEEEEMREWGVGEMKRIEDRPIVNEGRTYCITFWVYEEEDEEAEGENEFEKRKKINKISTDFRNERKSGRFVVKTRIEDFHLNDITALQPHTVEPRFFFTLSMDTYFKAWREVRAPSSSSSSSFFSCILEGSYRGLPPVSCALSSDASLLAIAHGSRTITLWSPSSFALLQSPLVLPPSSTLHSLARFYADTKRRDESEEEEEKVEKEKMEKRGEGGRYLEKAREECRHIGLLESPYGLYLVAATTSCIVLYDLLSLSICWVRHFFADEFDCRGSVMIDILLAGPPGHSNFAVVLAKTKSSHAHSAKTEKRDTEKKGSPTHASKRTLQDALSSSTTAASSDTGIAVYQEVWVFCLSSRDPSSSSSWVSEKAKKTKKKDEKEEEDTLLLLPPMGRTSISSDGDRGCRTQLLGVYVHPVWSREILASKTIEKTIIAACFSPPSSTVEENLFATAHLEQNKDLFLSSSVTSWPILHIFTADFQIESTHIPPFPIGVRLFASSSSTTDVLSSSLSLKANERMVLDAGNKKKKKDRNKEEEEDEKEEEETSEGGVTTTSLRKLQQYMQIEKVKQRMKKEEKRRGGVGHEENEEEKTKTSCVASSSSSSLAALFCKSRSSQHAASQETKTKASLLSSNSSHTVTPQLLLKRIMGQWSKEGDEEEEREKYNESYGSEEGKKLGLLGDAAVLHAEEKEEEKRKKKKDKQKKRDRHAQALSEDEENDIQQLREEKEEEEDFDRVHSEEKRRKRKIKRASESLLASLTAFSDDEENKEKEED